jgi:hypothetical protein
LPCAAEHRNARSDDEDEGRDSGNDDDQGSPGSEEEEEEGEAGSSEEPPSMDSDGELLGPEGFCGAFCKGVPVVP